MSSFMAALNKCLCIVLLGPWALLQDRDNIVKGLKKQVQQTLQFSNQAPQARLMEPIINQPVTSFQFAFKIRVREAALLHTLHLAGI